MTRKMRRRRRNPPPEEGKNKRGASMDLEVEAPKKGRVPLTDNSTLDTNNSSEWHPREKPLLEL